MDCAQHGVPSAHNAARPLATGETTIAATSGSDISYAAPASTGTVDGCILGGAATVGIIALVADSAGYQWNNNIINGKQNGINFLANGVLTSTVISGNRITNSLNGGGDAVFFTSAAADNVTVDQNEFGNNETDVNTTSGGSGLVVSSNTSVGSGNFMAMFKTDAAVITQNTSRMPSGRPCTSTAATAAH